MTKHTKITFILLHNWHFGILLFFKIVLSLWIVLLFFTQHMKKPSTRLWSKVRPLMYRKLPLKPLRLVSNLCKKVCPHKSEHVKRVRRLTFHVYPKHNHQWYNVCIYSYRCEQISILLPICSNHGLTTCMAFFIASSSVVGKYLYHGICIKSLTSFIIEDSWLCKASKNLHPFFDNSIIISSC